jgi:hypothetical protein
MILILDAKRLLSVPTSLAPARPGDQFEAEFDSDEDTIIFRRISEKSDWLAVLKECPVSMEDLPTDRHKSPRLRKS